MTAPDNFIYHEMMAHPALFTHAHPRNVVIINGSEILDEVTKHPKIEKIWQIETDASIQPHPDPRIIFHCGNPAEWIKQIEAGHVDIIISNTPVESSFHSDCLKALSSEGLLIQQCTSPFQGPSLKAIHQNLHSIGFHDVQILHFPQPSFPQGWRMAWMATKRHVFRRVSEKDIFNKTFKTRYYNLDVHKAALALPEFIREELEITS